MGKKIFIPITKNGNSYKLHVKDIRKIYSATCPSRPPIPSFNSPKQMNHEIENVDFEPLLLV